MKARILGRLRCPACGHEVQLRAFVEETIACHAGESAKEQNEQVVKAGVLLCEPCRVWYPISGYVPVMLPFATKFHARFAAAHAASLQAFAGYGPPQGKPQPGEQSIQETFTDEWDHVHQDELSFTYTLDDLKALNREVWLRWVEETRPDIHSVLNVGCGLGRESEAMRGVLPAAEIFGVDLNFALLQSGAAFKDRSDVHLVIASLFALPFAPQSFDLVYSQGVIHHTYSTRDAFKAIAAFARPGGHVFIWVYGLDDHLVLRGPLGLATRVKWNVEAVLRPLVSRSPKAMRDAFFAVLTTALHALLKTRIRHKGKWQWKNTNHNLRDWLSPRYAHRHSYNEVLQWFEDEGFKVVDVQSPAAYRRLFGKRLWGVGATGKRI